MKKNAPFIISFILLVAIGVIGYFLYQQELEEHQNSEKDVSDETTEDSDQVAKSERTNNIVLVLGANDYNDEEFTRVRDALEAENYNVTIASKGVTTAKGMNGGVAQVDLDITEVNVEDFDAIVFIGGSGAHEFFDDKDAQNLSKEFYNNGKITAAICSAPTILANAGLLEGKDATCFPGYEDNLTSKGANYTADPVTQDGLIITGSGPESATSFGEKIVEALS
ncbi:DJ-1/PfpI family protein [Candidatus Dojkabacteria bacterium]|nr:DJ-1/PfpI family protein [Candidatus Dojkabacteria bacterium]